MNEQLTLPMDELPIWQLVPHPHQELFPDAVTVRNRVTGAYHTRNPIPYPPRYAALATRKARVMNEAAA